MRATPKMLDCPLRIPGKTTVVGVLCCMAFISCGSLLFWPDRIIRATPDYFHFDYDNIYVVTSDGLTLHGWKIKPLKTHTAVVVFHGNGQNISTHFKSVLWMAKHGIAVYVFDYRGYGLSEGEAEFPGVFGDLRAAFDYVSAEQKNIVVLGQSLGAALAINFVGQNPDVRKKLNGLILDAPFSDYEHAAQDILSNVWFLWPFQYPLSLTMPGNRYDPVNYVKHIDIPVLLFHSVEDRVIDIKHSKALLKENPRMAFVQTSGEHIGTFFFKEHRERALRFIKSTGK